jgi:hypothetical protein
LDDPGRALAASPRQRSGGVAWSADSPCGIPAGQEDRKFDMPITLLDFILIGVMLVSALLAMIRGFMREILSIAAWVIAAVATLYAYSRLLPYAKTYFNNDIIAAGAVIG